MKTYITIQGDEWDIICFRYYGTEMVMDEVMKANPNLMDIAVFSAGTIVYLPEITTVVETSNKPPWMR